MFPPTIGKIMEPGSELLLQMHYGPAYQDELDQTTINIYFADVPLEREIETYIVTPANLSVPFYIPANEIVSFHGTVYVENDISIISTIPHSHLVGKSWLVYATSPDNQDTIPMISIPNWDFHWQGIFTYPSLLHIPGGYTVHAIAEYDNTSSNTFNPNNPPQDMWFGDFTTDEMYVLFFQFVGYLPGDESISIISDPIVGCIGDVATNGSIDISDILLILSQYGCLSECEADVDGDGAVSISDVLAVLAVFGETC
ncbi:MAG: hypothetical protein HN563_01985 [Flavobacteriales bacterium]|nr:hypothetical protein [Flavobacteriales bacterium]